MFSTWTARPFTLITWSQKLNGPGPVQGKQLPAPMNRWRFRPRWMTPRYAKRWDPCRRQRWRTVWARRLRDLQSCEVKDVWIQAIWMLRRSQMRNWVMRSVPRAVMERGHPCPPEREARNAAEGKHDATDRAAHAGGQDVRAP